MFWNQAASALWSQIWTMTAKLSCRAMLLSSYAHNLKRADSAINFVGAVSKNRCGILFTWPNVNCNATRVQSLATVISYHLEEHRQHIILQALSVTWSPLNHALLLIYSHHNYRTAHAAPCSCMWRVSAYLPDSAVFVHSSTHLITANDFFRWRAVQGTGRKEFQSSNKHLQDTYSTHCMESIYSSVYNY